MFSIHLQCTAVGLRHIIMSLIAVMLRSLAKLLRVMEKWRSMIDC
ncbi:hypothetical protein PAUR_b0280 [Pseudoalteromonas aurantia 208]|uniref:Uncharacterized protein n=1 Tax=Pseudoalteromonas aurantia 208 TaxID=1314867 RepID=A0ABR9EH63_9GAMM|nr:hypothetical protein [Pseudoalteromonas aurantia 208]